VYEYAVLVVAIIVLMKSSELTIRNAAALSKLTGVSQMAIGFMIIAVATSLPELAIAVISSVKGEGLLSLGNVIGANISNMALIFGVISLFGFVITKNERDESLKLVLGTILIGLAILLLKRIDIAFGIFGILIFYAFSKTIVKKGLKLKNHSEGIKTVEIVKSLLMLLLSIAVVIISANFVTDSAVLIARIAGVAESLIGATILAVGTTLPELSVNIAAIKKRNVDLAVGDTMGSLITNLTLVLGIAALINPMTAGAISSIAIGFMIFIGLAFMLFIFRRKFDTQVGFTLLALYAIYMAAMIGFGTI